jgi:hypothetical protein
MTQRGAMLAQFVLRQRNFAVQYCKKGYTKSAKLSGFHGGKWMQEQSF